MYRYSMWPLAQRTRYTADWIGCWVRLCGVPSVAWQERSGIDYDGALVVGRKNLQDEMSRLDLEQDRFDNDSSARAGGGSLIFELQHWSSVLRGVLLGGFFGGGCSRAAFCFSFPVWWLKALLWFWLIALLSATGLTGAGCILRVGASKRELNTVVQREMGAVVGDGCNGTLCGLAL